MGTPHNVPDPVVEVPVVEVPEPVAEPEPEVEVPAAAEPEPEVEVPAAAEPEPEVEVEEEDVPVARSAALIEEALNATLAPAPSVTPKKSFGL